MPSAVVKAKQQSLIFSGPLIGPLQRDEKTQTRRLRGLEEINRNPEAWSLDYVGSLVCPESDRRNGRFGARLSRRWRNRTRVTWIVCPYGAPGAAVWVRETWQPYRGFAQEEQPNAPFLYRADEDDCGQYPCITEGREVRVNARGNWRPSIHMPRWASRFTLRLTEIRLQRLRDISDADAKAEGTYGLISQGHPGTFNGQPSTNYIFDHKLVFLAYWDCLNKDRGYPVALNPWVWALSFRRVEPTGGPACPN